MGELATYLQENFAKLCPPDWTCQREVPVLEPRLAKLFGYAPKADVVLQRVDGSRKLWIEFEVSRADPVANHAKFATAHLFQPQRASETFVSMVSSHVARGRRNLAANTIHLMRHIGMRAFQTTLLPQLPPDEIRRINHLGKDAIAALNLDTCREIDRAMQISEPLAMTDRYRVFFVGDLLDVMCNLEYWNRAIQIDNGRRLWGRRRRFQYFVFDPKSKLFAPSKFCAFRPIAREDAEDGCVLAPNMTIEFYCNLGETDPRFDGGRAWRHLCHQLGMLDHVIRDSPGLATDFRKWLCGVEHAIEVDSKLAIALCPPKWFD